MKTILALILLVCVVPFWNLFIEETISQMSLDDEGYYYSTFRMSEFGLPQRSQFPLRLSETILPIPEGYTYEILDVYPVTFDAVCWTYSAELHVYNSCWSFTGKVEIFKPRTYYPEYISYDMVDLGNLPKIGVFYSSELGFGWLLEDHLTC